MSLLTNYEKNSWNLNEVPVVHTSVTNLSVRNTELMRSLKRLFHFNTKMRIKNFFLGYE